MIKGLFLLIAFLGSLLGLSAWLVPILWRHGSSAAFNVGCLLVLANLVCWWAAYELLKPRRK